MNNQVGALARTRLHRKVIVLLKRIGKGPHWTDLELRVMCHDLLCRLEVLGNGEKIVISCKKSFPTKSLSAVNFISAKYQNTRDSEELNSVERAM